MASFTCFNSLLAATILSTYFMFIASNVSGEISLLNLDGFRISARILIIGPNSQDIDRELIVNEYYSNQDKRSRLDIEPLDGSRKSRRATSKIIQYYYDGSSGAKQFLRLTNNRQDDCKIVDAQVLADDLFGNLSSVDRHLTSVEWLKERNDIPDYMIGVARLLAVVEANKNRMGLSDGGNHALIRNQKSVRYVLRDYLGTDNPNKLTIYYGTSQDHPNDIPLRIWYMQEKTKAEIIVDFTRFNILGHDSIAANDIAGIYHTFHMFPLDSGCSSQLTATNLIGNRPSPKLVSFRMSLYTYVDSSPDREYFVAYDGFVQALRRDELNLKKDHTSVSTIHDFRLQRRYNIRRPKHHQSEVSHEFSANVFGDSESQCAAAQILPEQKPQLDSLIPYKELSKMGTATVRGVEAVVFEQVSEILPELFFPLVNQTKQKKMEFKYSIIYYFASSTINGTSFGNSPLKIPGSVEQQVGPLMRIQVLHKGLIRYIVDIEEFLWQLTDAPNGDRADELFALEDTCFGSRLKPESFATLSLDFQVPLSVQRQPVNMEDMFKALNGSVSRNKGLIRALSDVGLVATRIYDIESRVYKHNADTLGIRTIAKLNHQNQMLYEPVLVGNGVWRLQAELTEAKNFDDCFWDAMHRRNRGGEVLFAFCYSSCRIEQNVNLRQEQDGNVKVLESKGFTIGPMYTSCQVYRLSRLDDKSELIASRSLFKAMQETLKVTHLELPLPFREDQKLNEILLVTKVVQVGNNRWTAESTNEPSTGGVELVNAGALIGVGLTVEGGATRVQPKRPEVFDSDHNDGEEVTSVMSYSLCHSTCLAKINCKSFSLCSGSGQPECLISELEFRDLELVQQIEQQSNNLRSINAKGGTITIQQPVYQVSTEDEPAINASTSTLIELRVDRRCHLYNKQALELFQEHEEAVSIGVRNRSLLAVDSEEQCAEICIQKNARFFKNANKRRLKALTSDDLDDQKSFLSKIRALEGGNLRSWCHMFAYVDIMERKLPDKLQEIIDPYKMNKTGLCYLSRAPQTGSKSSTTNATRNEMKVKIRMHKYEFKYNNLFGPKYGEKLHPLKPKRRLDLEQLTPDELRDFVRNGNEQVVFVSRDVETCARICFLQTAHIEPWCQSFGFFQDQVPLTTGATNVTVKPRSYCIFNSITLEAAKRSQMVDQLVSNVPKNLNFLHYEPQNVLNLDGFIFDQLISGDKFEPTSRRSSSNFRFSQTGTLILLALALISGLYLVQFISPHLIASDQITDSLEANQNTDLPTTTTTTTGNRGGILSIISNIAERRLERDMDLSSLVSRTDDGEN